MDQKNLKIGIVGAGIQGVCTALFLQKKGGSFEACSTFFFQKSSF